MGNIHRNAWSGCVVIAGFPKQGVGNYGIFIWPSSGSGLHSSHKRLALAEGGVTGLVGSLRGLDNVQGTRKIGCEEHIQGRILGNPPSQDKDGTTIDVKKLHYHDAGALCLSEVQIHLCNHISCKAAESNDRDDQFIRNVQ